MKSLDMQSGYTIDTASEVNHLQSHLTRKDRLSSLLIIKYCKRIGCFSLHTLSELDRLTTGNTENSGWGCVEEAAYQLCKCLDL